MGNKSSTEYGGIFIQTTQSFYYPGQVVNGTIHLNITSDGYPGRKVLVVITGKEILHRALNRSEDSDDEQFDLNLEKTKYIFKKEIQLYSFKQNTIPIGQYCAQFNFTLPHHLPGTYNSNHLSGAYERIIYKIKGIVIATKGFKNMSHIQQFQIKELVEQEETQVAQSGKISGDGCCFTQYPGVQITAICDKNLYRIGEPIRCLIEVNDDDNEVKADTIILELQNILNYKYEYFDSKKINVLQHIEIPTKIKKLGSKKLLNQQEVVLYAQKQNHNGNDLYDQIQPTTTGHLIKSTFRIVVKPKLGVSCCGSSDFISMPINILSNSVLQQQHIQPPSGWNPIYLNDDTLNLLSRSKHSSISLLSYSTQQKTNQQDRNSQGDNQGSQKSYKVINSQKLNEMLNSQMD